MRNGVIETAARLAAVVLVGFGSAACGLFGSDVSDVPVPTILTIVAGDGQTATVNQPVPTPVSVHIVDQYNNAMQGYAITWTVRSGGGRVDNTTTVTNLDGNATTVWTLGPTVGTQSLQATTTNALVRIINVTAVAGSTN
jgi:hypothetical protein